MTIIISHFRGGGTEIREVCLSAQRARARAGLPDVCDGAPHTTAPFQLVTTLVPSPDSQKTGVFACVPKAHFSDLETVQCTRIAGSPCKFLKPLTLALTLPFSDCGLSFQLSSHTDIPRFPTDLVFPDPLFPI